ncbi:MAG: glycosyltransferase family 4 protein [Sedimentisphaerales bacterium]|nr:glycosyltransferase family 4 protein [Sedimentisphaerales bacterium]
MDKKLKIATLSTTSVTIKAFFDKQFQALNENGLETYVICAPDEKLKEFLPAETIFLPVSFTRIVSPFKDIVALFQLIKIFRKNKFDLVQYCTFKAALLGSIAAFIVRIPIRIHLLWGLYYEGQKGIKRKISKFIAYISCSLSTHVLPNSHSMAKEIVDKGIVKNPKKCEVLLNGSACGVDLDKFSMEKLKKDGLGIRNKLNVKEGDVLIGIFGRLTGDKGVNEIVAAFERLSKKSDRIKLLIVGEEEEKDRLSEQTRKAIEENEKIIKISSQKDVKPYFSAIDIFCLPSYREGFPQTPLEAMALGKPCVCTDTWGAKEAVEHSVTGYIVESRNAEALIAPLTKLVENPYLRQEMGDAGRKRVERLYDSKDMLAAIIDHRMSLLSSNH